MASAHKIALFRSSSAIFLTSMFEYHIEAKKMHPATNNNTSLKICLRFAK